MKHRVMRPCFRRECRLKAYYGYRFAHDWLTFTVSDRRQTSLPINHVLRLLLIVSAINYAL